MKIIEVKNLIKSYKDKKAVDQVSFQVEKGEFFGLLGHNGAGKSTTIDCILGLKTPDRGTATILGMEAKKHRKELFEKVGVQLQQSFYQEKIKVKELCEEKSVLYQNPADYQELLRKFSLFPMSNQYVSSLSGGEKQKLSVLLALLPRPEVVFLDELTTGLDTAARREVWKYLLELKKQGVTIIMTSHYMDEVEALCDRIYIMKEGKCVTEGSVRKIIDDSPYDKLEDAYLWYMGEELTI